MINGWVILCDIALNMSLDLTDHKSTLNQVNAWCHYLIFKGSYVKFRPHCSGINVFNIDTPWQSHDRDQSRDYKMAESLESNWYKCVSQGLNQCRYNFRLTIPGLCNISVPMMTSSNGNISALLAICAGNSSVPGKFPSDAELWFFLSASE